MEGKEAGLKTRSVRMMGMGAQIEGAADKKCKRKLEKKLSINSDKFVICKSNNIDTDYEVLDKIGEGSFGSVYRVLHKVLKLKRALKKIKKQKTQNFSTFEEIQVLKELDHRNILKIYEFYETEDAYLIITDIFEEGRELFDEIISLGKITEEMASKLIREVLLTLNYTHSKGIAHRDIKPENILVKDIDSNKIKLKIIDWGLGTLIKGEKSKRVCGTPEYAAPEVHQGIYSVSCDMWSLGVMAFIMLTGNYPFKGTKTQQTIEKVKKSVINFKKTGFMELSPEAKDFIIKLLKKVPNERLSAVQALQHSWIKKYEKKQAEPVFLKETLERLKQFTVTNQFGLAIMNLINNHFCSNEEKQKLEEIFSFLDANGDGVLSTEELVEGYTRLYGKALGEKIAEETFMKLDVNHNGSLEYSQFVALGLQREKQNEKAKLREAFNLFDEDKSGSISWKEVSRVLEDKLEGVTKEQIFQLMEDFDKDGNNQIDFEEFYAFVRNIFEKMEERRKSQERKHHNSSNADHKKTSKRGQKNSIEVFSNRRTTRSNASSKFR